MTTDTKQYIHLHLSILKEAMKQEGLIFGIAVDKNEPNNSKLCFIDKEQYLTRAKHDGIMVSLQDLNNGLI